MVKLQEAAEDKEEKERQAKIKMMDPEEVKPEDLVPRHTKKTSERGFSDGEYASTAHNEDDLTDEELEQHQLKNQKWEEETDERDHREIRMLNKVKRLETIVENTNLIINYIENQGSIMLSQLDNFMVDKKDGDRHKMSSADKSMEDKKKMSQVMGDIDDLCLNSRDFRNDNAGEKYELITKDMKGLRESTGTEVDKKFFGVVEPKNRAGKKKTMIISSKG